MFGPLCCFATCIRAMFVTCRPATKKWCAVLFANSYHNHIRVLCNFLGLFCNMLTILCVCAVSTAVKIAHYVCSKDVYTIGHEATIVNVASYPLVAL